MFIELDMNTRLNNQTNIKEFGRGKPVELVWARVITMKKNLTGTECIEYIWKILRLQKKQNPTGVLRALDCGAGIGRVTKMMLSHIFEEVCADSRC